MGLENVPRCQHVKLNGIQCGSPALRRRRHCYFHTRVRETAARIADSKPGQPRFVLPLLEDANAVQLALMEVMLRLASGQMDHKTAGLMLYALQTASANLRNTRFEALDVTEVVIDRKAVGTTCIGGPQWEEEDFDDDEEEEEDDEEVDDEEEEDEDEDDDEVEAESEGEKAAEDDGKVSVEEARKRVQGMARDWVMSKLRN